jgi:aspartyl-tRNA(Asn)/glutamyl-tRNA(Gln) amidotransferase subunit C
MSTLSRKDPLTRQEVAHLARLARLAVTDEELDLFAGQLDAVLEAVATVGQADVGDVPPTTHAVPMTNVMRPDVVLAGAPAAEEDRFRVPRILQEEA